MLREQIERNRLKGRRIPPKIRGEYSHGITLRFLFMVCLWVFYGMVPHKLPTVTLLIFTLILGLYAAWLFSKKLRMMAWVIVLVAILNTLLFPMLNADINTIFPILLIYALLIFDVINAPR